MPTSSVRGSPAKGKANGPPAQLIQEWLGNRIAFIVSEPLIVEVEHTFESPYFIRKVTPEKRRDALTVLRQRSRIVPIDRDVQGIATHPEDDLILATALSGGAPFLVTGDHGLLRLGSYEGVSIVTVRAFLAMLPGLRANELR